MANSNLSEAAVISKVAELRQAFKEKYSESLTKDVYDDRDLQRLDADDRFAACFLRTMTARGDVTKALGVIDQSLRFRKSIGLLDLQESDFPEEMTSRRAIYYQGVDKEGHPIMYVNVKENTAKGAEELALLKKYIAFYFNLHHSQHAGDMVVVFMDMSGASTSNVDIDVTKFIITCFTAYFPAYLAYMINYEMPFLLSATWKIISAFLSAEQKQKIRMVKKNDISNYIATEHLWEHMK